MTLRRVLNSWGLRGINYQAEWVRQWRRWHDVLRIVRKWPKGVRAGRWS